MNEERNFSKTSINWYPGHMAKTKKQIIQDLKLIDIVIEILDARIPMSSRNPDINELTKNELNNDNENFIIGGASLYNYFYNLADRMYLTLIDEEDSDADTYFPKINYDMWKQTFLGENEDNGIKYKHILFERIHK